MITKISSDAMIFRLMPEQRAWKELNYENLKWNVEKLKEHLPEHCAFMAVVKADAYGHGALPVSSYLNRIGVRAFAVATLQEGIALHQTVPPKDLCLFVILRFDHTKFVHGLAHNIELDMGYVNFHAARLLCAHEIL